MKNGKRWLGLFLFVIFILSFFIGGVEVEAAKKKTKTKYLKAKKIDVKYQYDFKNPNYYAWEEGTTLLSYKKKDYVNVKEFSRLLSDTNLEFDVKAGKKDISFVLSKPFSDENYYRADLGYKKAVDAKIKNVSVKVGSKKFKIKVLQSVYYGDSDIFFPLDFFEKNLGFSVRKQKNNLFIGEKIFTETESYEVKLLSTGKSETVTSLRFADKTYLALKDLKRLVKDSSSSFGYDFDEKKDYINILYCDKEKGSEEKLTLSSKNDVKFRELRVNSSYYGKLEMERDYEENPNANLPNEFVRTKALILKNDTFLSLDFLCDFMNYSQKTTGNEILLDDKKRENFRVLKGASGEENEEFSNNERWSSPFYDALYEENGNLVSIQAESDQEEGRKAFVTVQIYGSDFSLQSEKKISFEGEKFGAFFKGSLYNFILFGNNNPKNSDAKVTYHLVKYDKEFNRLGSLEIRGAYTAIPFDAGTARMAESGDSLVIHAAKERYNGHQSQMTFIVSMSSMTLMNADDIGDFQQNHVSHSFDQRVEIDENQNVYLLDHGDAYPRSLVLTKMAIENGRLVYRTGDRRGGGNRFDLITFPGQTGANQTGFTLGSMVQGSRNLLIGGNHIDYSKAKGFDSFNITGVDVDKRDAYLFVVNKMNPSLVNKIRLTNYALDGKDISYSSPRVLKINEEKYLVLWNKYVKKGWNATASLCYQYMNQDGSFLTEKREIEGMEMTKTEPIFVNGKALWTNIVKTDYETKNTSKILFTLTVE